MKSKAVCFSLLVLALCAGCATAPSQPPSGEGLTPYEVIQMAAEAAPQSIRGPFVVRIQAAGTQSGNTYLNTELDYRDQRNLTIAMNAAVARELEQRLGEDPKTALIGQQLRIEGRARRVRIVFNCGGMPTQSYYYQTHVDLLDADRLVLLD